MLSRHVAGLIAAIAAVAALLAAPAPLAASDDRGDGKAIACLALTIYHEARGESERGRLAVGHVVMNRTRNALFPAGVCAVVRQGGQLRDRCQFSWWCDGRSDRPRDKEALQESLRLAERIYYGCMPDPTAGALWYHAVGIRPSWSKSLGSGKRIDRHVFYRANPDRPVRIQAAATSSQACQRRTPPRTLTLLAGS